MRLTRNSTNLYILMKFQLLTFYKVIATGLGSGLSPFAPGTMGAILAWCIWYILSLVLPIGQCWCATVALTVVLTLVGIPASGAMERLWGNDPKQVVVDEMVGTWIALLAITDECSIWWSVAALGLFRIFDIFKPLGIRRLEALGGGLGIMADDILAGVYSALLLAILQCII